MVVTPQFYRSQQQIVVGGKSEQHWNRPPVESSSVYSPKRRMPQALLKAEENRANLRPRASVEILSASTVAASRALCKRRVGEARKVTKRGRELAPAAPNQYRLKLCLTMRAKKASNNSLRELALLLRDDGERTKGVACTRAIKETHSSSDASRLMGMGWRAIHPQLPVFLEPARPTSTPSGRLDTNQGLVA